MGERATIDQDYLYDIADAIRAKNGSSDTYTPAQMAAAIGAIPTGGDVTVEALSVTQNGTHTAPPGKAYSPVTVNVPNTYGARDEGKVVVSGALVSQTAHAKITENGTFDTTHNNSVTVEMPVPSGELVISEDGYYDVRDYALVKVLVRPPLQTKEATTNGVVTPDKTGGNNYYGLSKVIVRVPGLATAPHIEYCSAVQANSSVSGAIGKGQAATIRKIMLIAMNNSNGSASSCVSRIIINDTYITPSSTVTHERQGSGTDRRSYKIDIYDVVFSDYDSYDLGYNSITANTSWAFAYITDDFEISKVMSSAAAATSGSNDKDGCVMYGTFDDANGGTVSSADYKANTVITTDNPGSGNKSSFIIWLTGK